jgi:N-formylglutamate amidohydrolase
MIDTYTFVAGDAPLLISIPHDGRQLPCEIGASMTAAGRAIPDTDWHVRRLYDFADDLGASLIQAEYSRYVVDLNRPADDTALYEGRFGTGLCPTRTFAGQEIYEDGTTIDVNSRVRDFWQPYHDRISATLAQLRERHGHALLWDAHSIPGRVPALFDGELPELNLGTWDGRSCDPRVSGPVVAVAESSGYRSVTNGRFKGGYITRHYGRPDENVHAIQLEISQRSYMDELSLDYQGAKAAHLRDTLRQLLETFLAAATRQAAELTMRRP